VRLLRGTWWALGNAVVGHHFRSIVEACEAAPAAGPAVRFPAS